MRLFGLLIVVVVAVLLWAGWRQWQHESALREKAAAAIESGHADDAASKAPPKQEQEPSAAQSYYRFIDEAGTLRFVDSLEKVPEPLRASARPVTMNAASGNDGDTSSYSVTGPSRAKPKRPARRPFSDTYQPTPAYRGPSSADSLSDD